MLKLVYLYLQQLIETKFLQLLQHFFHCIYTILYVLHKLYVGFDHNAITMEEIRDQWVEILHNNG